MNLNKGSSLHQIRGRFKKLQVKQIQMTHQEFLCLLIDPGV
jgi:hypothetical protein